MIVLSTRFYQSLLFGVIILMFLTFNPSLSEVSVIMPDTGDPGIDPVPTGFLSETDHVFSGPAALSPINLQKNSINQSPSTKSSEPSDKASAATRIQPSDFTYLGAFRLPDGTGDYGWGYGGHGLTSYPSGDPGGADDGYPGSLYAHGINTRNYVGEISIPAPKKIVSGDLTPLNTATQLKPFTDLTTGVFANYEVTPLVGDVCYLPKQGQQTTDKIYFSLAEWLVGEAYPTHAMTELSLSKTDVKGPWQIGSYTDSETTDYLFRIPASFANQYLNGYRLATGRFREGSWSGSGPTIFAIAPWLDGNPPPKNAQLSHITRLLQYEREYEGGTHILNNYTQADMWTGADWITAGSKSAVVIAGTKGRGNCWYGFANGVVWPDEPPYPPIPDPPYNDRGWWTDSFEAIMIFYDPDDLAKVARGEMEPYEPQPYAEMKLDPYLSRSFEAKEKYHVQTVAFDEVHGFFYLIEYLADNDKPLIHVFKVSGTSTNAPTIRLNSPTKVCKSSSTGYTMRVSGLNLSTGATLKISDANPARPTNIIGPWSLTASSDRTYAKTSDNGFVPNSSWRSAVYDVTVTNPDGQSATRRGG